MTITARGATVRALGVVTAGTLVANLLAYVVQVPASRVLGPDGFGEFSVLNAAMLVLSVPALALQAVVAREVVGGADRTRLWRLIAVVTVVVAVGSGVGVAVMMQLAHTSWASTTAALAGAAPLAFVSGGQGFLQGAGRFGVLGGVLAGVGVARSAPVVAAVLAGTGPAGALAAGTIGTVVAAVVVAVIAARSVSPPPPGERAERVEAAVPATPARGASPRDVLAASSVQFVMIVAVSVDLLLSRSVLSADDAGVYALGAVATKAAFWLPQAIGVVVYPRLADPVRSAASLRRAGGVLAAIGVAVTALAAVAGPLVPTVISDDYRPVAGWMWLFALTGALLAVLQLMLLAAIARNRARGAVPAFAVLAVEVVLIVTVAGSVLSLASIAAGAAVVAVAATWVWLRAAE